MAGVSVSRRVCDPKSQLFVILVWRGDRGQELGAGAKEELAEDGKGLVTAAAAGGGRRVRQMIPLMRRINAME
jgi:hypothetical protein